MEEVAYRHEQLLREDQEVTAVVMDKLESTYCGNIRRFIHILYEFWGSFKNPGKIVGKESSPIWIKDLY